MFYFVYIGNPKGKQDCLEVVRRHAQWLGLNVILDEVQNSSDVYVGRLLPMNTIVPDSSQVKHKGELFYSISGIKPDSSNLSVEGLWKRLIDDMPGNYSWMHVGNDDPRLKIVVPPATPEQIYYCQDSRGMLISNDLRLNRLWANPELNDIAVVSLFQYGTIPLSMSIFEKIHRIPPGHVFEYDFGSKNVMLKPSFAIERSTSTALDDEKSEDAILENLDSVLGDLPTSSALFFSGGTDSSLLAARMLKLGRNDIPLINYSFGPDDEQARYAEEIARHLSMHYQRIEFRQDSLSLMLERIGRDYSYPFGDNSVIPTNLLVNQALSELKTVSAVIDGTGADGAFGIGQKVGAWQQIYQIPWVVRMTLSQVYKWAKIWKFFKATSKVEALLRAARRSVQMPLLRASIIAQNPLEGVAFDLPRNYRSEIEKEFQLYFEPLVEGCALQDQGSFLDMIQVCGGAFAAKVFDPLRNHGVRTVFPFMATSLLHTAYSLSWEQKCHNKVEKAILKKILRNYLPGRMIDRPKHGFLTPVVDVFAHERVQDYFRAVILTKNNPITSFLKKDVVEAMIERARRRKPLSVGARNFLWVIAFTSAWLDQQPS